MSQIPDDILRRLQAGDLIAAIAQDNATNEVLMLAWMNEEALQKTIESKQATYWSRSRNQLWLKGESSGHFQQVTGIYFDCDADAILLKVNQTGVACHTGEKSCFHNEITTK